MHEIHNMIANAMIADAAHRHAARPGAPSRTASRVRWWRPSNLRTNSTNVTH